VTGDADQGWRIHAGRGLAQTFKVYGPGCPAEPHAERHCRCRSFSRLNAAEQYMREQVAIDAETD
jgi:hypothetical protein